MENDPSIEEANANLALLAQAAVTEHALTPLQTMCKHWRAFLWCNFMCIGALSSGYGAQVGIQLSNMISQDFGNQGTPPLPISWFNNVSAIGGMFGGLSFGWVSDRFGRRAAVAIASAVSIIGVLIQFVTPKHNNDMLLVGMLVNGFALGMFVSSASAYCAEVSPLALRGITTTCVNLWIVLGQFMSDIVFQETRNRQDVYAYRLPFAVQWIFPLVLLIGLPFAPESPWWLVRKGRYAAAERVLARLGGPTVDVTFQRQKIQETIELEDSYTATSAYLDCFRGGNLKRTIVAMMVFVLQQGAGSVFVSQFSTPSSELSVFANSNYVDFAVGVTAMEVVGNLLTFWTVNRFGRRSLFNWGMIACAFILVMMGFAEFWKTDHSAQLAVFAFKIIYTFIYQASVGPVGYVLFAEVSSAKLRSKTVGIGICVNWLCEIPTSYLVNSNEVNSGGYIGFIFGVLAFLGSVWAFFFIPETKGRTVDELDLLYEKRVPAIRFASYRLHRDGEQ